MPNPHPRLRILIPIGRLKQCKQPAPKVVSIPSKATESKLKVHISRLFNIQRHSAHSPIIASTLKHGVGAIGISPPRIDLTDVRVEGPREDVGCARDEKGLCRIADWVGEVVDIAVCNLLTEVITTAERRGGGEGALLRCRYFESGV